MVTPTFTSIPTQVSTHFIHLSSVPTLFSGFFVIFYSIVSMVDTRQTAGTPANTAPTGTVTTPSTSLTSITSTSNTATAPRVHTTVNYTMHSARPSASFMTSLIQPEPFRGGRGDDPSDWIKRFQLYASASHLPEEDYAQILPLYLADNAWDWYKYLPLDTQFSSHTEKWLVQTDLFSRRQKQGEPSSEYIRWMVKKAPSRIRR